MMDSILAAVRTFLCFVVVALLSLAGCAGGESHGDESGSPPDDDIVDDTGDDDVGNDDADDDLDDDADGGDDDGDAPSACEEALEGEVDACFEGLTADDVCETADAECWVECFEHTSDCTAWADCVESVCVNGEDPWWNDDDADDDDADDDIDDDDIDDDADDDTGEDDSFIGRVILAVVPQPVEGARLDFYAPSRRDATPVATTTTSVSGDYSLSLPPGEYHVVITPPDGLDLAVAEYDVEALADDPTPPFSTMLMNENMDDNQVRIALQWGFTPADLDSHLLAPCPDSTPGACGDSNTYHLYFAARQWSQYFNLDVDDTTSYGPEVMTVLTATPGTYRFAVHDYTNLGSGISSAMSLSEGLQVIVFGPSGNTVYRPDGETPGTVWMVVDLDYDGSGWTLTEVNDWCFGHTADGVFEACP